MPSRRRPSRRRFLLSAALAAGLAGCTGGDRPNSTATESDAVGTTGATPATASRTTGTTPTAETTTADTTTEAETTTVEPEAESPESDAVRWRVAVDAPITLSPAVGDGAAYVAVGKVDHYRSGKTDATGTLVALDAGDGSPDWTARLPAPPLRDLSVHEGNAYCVSGGSSGFWGIDNRLHRFGGDGTERWRTDPVDQFLNLLAFGDGRAYLGTSDDALGLDGQTLFAVGRDDGQRRWSVGTGDTFDGRYLDGTLVTAPGGGRAVAVRDASSGERRWSKRVRPLGTGANALPLADGALLAEVAGEDDARLAALELDDGTERWSYAGDDAASFAPTAAGVVGDAVIGAEYRGRAFGLDAADGTERWTFDVDAEHGALVVGEGLAFVGGSDALYALDPVAGTEQWRVSGDGIRPAVAEGGVLLATGGRRDREFVAAFDSNDGTERWSFETYENLTAPVVADGAVFVASERGIVRALGN